MRILQRRTDQWEAWRYITGIIDPVYEEQDATGGSVGLFVWVFGFIRYDVRRN
jgi:hypothetical protein